jgi:hypothetical protein
MSRYSVPDQFTFLLPSLILIALAAGVGMDVLTQRSMAWRNRLLVGVSLSILTPPILYGSLPSVARRFGVTGKRERVLPYRDELRYWLAPWKHNERSAQRFASQALQEALPNGTILADNTSQPPLTQTSRAQTKTNQIESHPNRAWASRWLEPIAYPRCPSCCSRDSSADRTSLAIIIPGTRRQWSVEEA